MDNVFLFIKDLSKASVSFLTKSCKVGIGMNTHSRVFILFVFFVSMFSFLKIEISYAQNTPSGIKNLGALEATLEPHDIRMAILSDKAGGDYLPDKNTNETKDYATELAKELAKRAPEKKVDPRYPGEDFDELGPLGKIWRRAMQAWHSEGIDLYFPFIAWHNDLMYHTSYENKYNEHPWGGGIGKSVKDDDGDTHMVFAMAFLDSHDEVQPIAGYAYMKNWYLDDKDEWSVGVGYALGLTAREEWNWIPFPGLLPIFGIEYKGIAIQGSYIPGTYNHGNVLFAWLRVHLE